MSFQCHLRIMPCVVSTGKWEQLIGYNTSIKAGQKKQLLCTMVGDSVFSLWEISRVCVLFHYSKLFISSDCCPLWPVFGFGSNFFISLPGFLCLEHPLEVFPCSLPFLQSRVISLDPIYSTFSAKDKDEGSSTILSHLKKFISISSVCICFTKSNSGMMMMAGIFFGFI